MLFACFSTAVMTPYASQLLWFWDFWLKQRTFGEHKCLIWRRRCDWWILIALGQRWCGSIGTITMASQWLGRVAELISCGRWGPTWLKVAVGQPQWCHYDRFFFSTKTNRRYIRLNRSNTHHKRWRWLWCFGVWPRCSWPHRCSWRCRTVGPVWWSGCGQRWCRSSCPPLGQWCPHSSTTPPERRQKLLF